MLTKWQQIKKQAEASKFPDIELLGFVSRGPLIVLQTSQENFEAMNKSEKLEVIGFMEKSLVALKDLVSKDP